MPAPVVDVTRTVADLDPGLGRGAGDADILGVGVGDVIRSIVVDDPGAGLIRGHTHAIGVGLVDMTMRMIRSRVVIGVPGPILRRGIRKGAIDLDRTHTQDPGQDQEQDPARETPDANIPRSTTVHALALDPDRVPAPTRNPHAPERSHPAAVPALPAAVAPDLGQLRVVAPREATLPNATQSHPLRYIKSQRKSLKSLKNSNCHRKRTAAASHATQCPRHLVFFLPL